MSTVVQETSDRVLHIRLNRPDKRNAVDDDMFNELVAAAEAARDNTELAAIVLSGAGRSFCAGLDFAVHQSFASEGGAGQRPYADPSDPTSTGRTPGRGQRIVRAFRDARVPVIAAIHGHAIGAGLQISLGCDIRIVTADVQLGCAEIDFGMTVDMGASQLLPRLIGTDRTMDLLLSGRLITGAEAVRWGLATRLSDDPLTEALDLARSIARRSPHAVAETKRLVRLAETSTVKDGMAQELLVMANNIGSPAQVEAVQRYFAARQR
ncbi:enoyl-CoA hydratase-related protein [Mycolicibacterium sp.]|uniref:enoyl-CoA hydratase-related protein n=1 Tax=Mycolicibacterium sp. TaxID=2320850 RepID=UPI001A3581F3|nr:enoyl-CoA hydratase-related protein [Mycolicibacterium sp.]MBJ7336775.1 enoyl-CoA hydratase/isomerase family protein [Mycolicibacterium sp.]